MILFHLFQCLEQGRRFFSMAEIPITEGCEADGVLGILKFKKIGIYQYYFHCRIIS